jgi:hypothetical protein
VQSHNLSHTLELGDGGDHLLIFLSSCSSSSMEVTEVLMEVTKVLLGRGDGPRDGVITSKNLITADFGVITPVSRPS